MGVFIVFLSYNYLWSLYYSTDNCYLLLENIVVRIVSVEVVVAEFDLRNLNDLESVMDIVVVVADCHSTSVEVMIHLNFY